MTKLYERLEIRTNKKTLVIETQDEFLSILRKEKEMELKKKFHFTLDTKVLDYYYNNSVKELNDKNETYVNGLIFSIR